MRPRKLPPETEEAIREWYARYRDALIELRGLGSIAQQAKCYGISARTLHAIVKREQYELSRKCHASGVIQHGE